MSSLLWGSALKALGDGGVAAGKSLERSNEVDQKLAQDAALKRESMQLQRDLLEARLGAGVGGVGGSGGGKKSGAPMAPEMFNQAMDNAAGLEPGGYGKIIDRSAFEVDKPLQGPVDESGQELLGSYRGMVPDMEELRARKLEELRPLREALALGGGSDYKALAEGRSTDQRTNLLTKFQGGDDKAGETYALASQGNIFNGTSEVSRNVVTGASDLTPIGTAEVKKKASEVTKNNAAAAKDSADAKKTKDEGSAGGKAATVQSVISSETGEAVAVMRDGSLRQLGIKSAAFNEKVAALVQKIADKDFEFRDLPPEEQRKEAIKRLTGKSPDAKPPAKIDALPAGAKQIGTSNGKPVYETPDGRRFRAD